MMKKIISVFLIFSTFAGCSFFQKRLSVKNCSFNILDVSVNNFTFTKMTVRIKITITNPNDIDVVIDKLDLDLLINDKKTVKVEFAGLKIETGKMRMIKANLVVPYKAVGMSIINIIKNKGQISYKLIGHIYLNTILGIIKFPVTIYKND